MVGAPRLDDRGREERDAGVPRTYHIRLQPLLHTATASTTYRDAGVPRTARARRAHLEHEALRRPVVLEREVVRPAVTHVEQAVAARRQGEL